MDRPQDVDHKIYLVSPKKNFYKKFSLKIAKILRFYFKKLCQMMQLFERIILKVLVRVGVDGKVEKIGVTVSKNPVWARAILI